MTLLNEFRKKYEDATSVLIANERALCISAIEAAVYKGEPRASVSKSSLDNLQVVATWLRKEGFTVDVTDREFLIVWGWAS